MRKIVEDGGLFLIGDKSCFSICLAIWRTARLLLALCNELLQCLDCSRHDERSFKLQSTIQGAGKK